MKRLPFLAILWIDALVILLFSGIISSGFSRLSAGVEIGFFAACTASIVRIIKIGPRKLLPSRPHGLAWGLVALVTFSAISVLAGPHCFLDSYSYRFPQMFFWLQEGHPWSIPNVDFRINQMPHVWPILSAGFFRVFGEWGVALPNFVSLLFLAALFKDWANRATTNKRLSDALALVFLSAPVFLLGASTNDNVMTCTALLALSFHLAWSEPPERKTIVRSAFALALCCGIKPQYVVLVPVWAIWYFFAPLAPWRKIAFRHLFILVPLLVLCSPVPTMAVNQLKWGSYAFPKVEASVQPSVAKKSNIKTTVLSEEPTSKSNSIAHSFTALFVAMTDIPFNPFYSRLNQIVSNHCPSTSIRYRPMLITEGASLGLFGFLLLVFGLVQSMIRRPKNHILTILAFLIPMCIATTVMTPGTLGRSFIGFFVPLFPIAMEGLVGQTENTKISRQYKVLVGYACFCLAMGLLVIVTDCSKPLWPVQRILTGVSNPALRTKLKEYAHYSKRQFGASELLREIPKTEKNIGLIAETGTPSACCWLDRPAGTKVIPYATTVSTTRLKADSVRYLVICHDSMFDPTTKTLSVEVCSRLHAKIVAHNKYTAYMSRGDDDWYLLQCGTGLD